jgi:hypothetical protein
MATQPKKPPQKKVPDTPRKARLRQPSTSGEEEEQATPGTSLPPAEPDELSVVKIQLAQLAQAMTAVQAQLQYQLPPPPQQNPLLRSPTRSQTRQQQPPAPDSASRRRLLTPDPDLDWEQFRDDLPSGPLVEVEDDTKVFKLVVMSVD